MSPQVNGRKNRLSRRHPPGKHPFENKIAPMLGAPKKKPVWQNQTGFLIYYVPSGLGALDIGSLLAFRALRHFEGNFFTFLQGLEAIHVDCGEVGEKIFATIVRGDKTKTFGIIEPLDCANCHVYNFHTKNQKITGYPDSLFELSDPVLMATLIRLNPNTMTFYLPQFMSSTLFDDAAQHKHPLGKPVKPCFFTTLAQ
jgi:hypothetical protein